MARENFWSRICKAFSGSKAEATNTNANDIDALAAVEAKEHTEAEIKKFRRAVFFHDVDTVKSMLENGYDVNHIFRRDTVYTVDGQYTVEDFEYYTILENVGEQMQRLLRRYGAKTFAELEAADRYCHRY